MGCFLLIKRQLVGRRLVFNILWCGIHISLFIIGWYKQANDQRLAILNLLRFSVWISRGSGLCLCLDGFLLFLPVCRNLMVFMRPKLGWLIPVDQNIWFHRQVAYTTLLFSAIHTTAHYVNMLNVERTQVRTNTAIGIMYTEPGGITGHVMLLIMVLMYTTSNRKIRRECFEAFWYTHHLAFFWALAFYTHATGCFVRGALPGKKVECIGYNSVYLTAWSGVAYFLDRLCREIRGRRSCKIIAVLVHPSGTVEIRMQKPSLKYIPGQWIFFQMPEISRFQWHPFTLSSAPDDPYISIHVRQVGDFTREVGERLGATPQLTATLGNTPEDTYGDPNDSDFLDITTLRSRDLPTIRIDGPYGAPAQDVFKCEVAVLIGAGIGVTPFSSILKNIYYKQQQGNLGALRKVQFIWLNKNIASFSWFRSLLKDLEDIQTNASFLRMDMYLTGVVDEDTISNLVLNANAQSFDTLTGLKSRTHFGRPHWARDIFGPIKQAINSGNWYGVEMALQTKVGVFYCGPTPLAKQLKDECRDATTSNVRFDFYQEHCESKCKI
ncbi:NADPH oxidase [Phakopsora pachyrhizi]|uniref:NADPH oxidase n=1 Tax=Phakopsora pachyrhizi TaxID=170000 RepID=A0AAV0BEV9_PHAPC|nr:NADPH oxidase [Phakopsora pachyrhizi]CAH7685782.1 NADPH oxidase [Phakopsora pachyrhizi]